MLFFEGVRYAWTDVVELAGTGVGSWIGVDEREVLTGLEMPPEIDLGRTVPWSAKLEQSKPISFGIRDLTGRDLVLDVFKAYQPDDLSSSLGDSFRPTQDPAPEFGVGPGQDPTVPLWGRHIGTEAIGPAGERRYLFCMPEGVPPGLDHVAGPGWPPAIVTDEPTVWEGRWWALYRVVYDEETQAYPSWLEQHQGGSLVSYGKVKGRGSWSSSRGGRLFQLACFGPASLLRKSINLTRPSRWIRPSTGGVSITGERARVAAWIANDPFRKIDDGGVAATVGRYPCQTLLSGNTLDGLTTRAEIVQRIREIVQCMITNTDQGPVLAATNSTWTGPGLPDPEWGSNDARAVNITADGSTIKIRCEDPTTPNPNEGYRIGLALDAAVWQLLGWDINAPGFTRNNGVCFVGGTLWGQGPGDAALPPFHYNAMFSTRANFEDPPDQWNNGGQWQVYTAPYQAGTVTLRPEAGDDIRLGVGVVRCASQYQWPFEAGAQIDGVDVDASGWWVFRGERITALAYEQGGDPEPFVQVALCQWVATASRDGVEIDGSGYARLQTIRWEDPRLFGYPFERMAEPWVSVLGGLECAPLGVIGGIGLPSGGGWRHRAIPSLLVSTGTVKWDAQPNVVVVVPGANHPPGLPVQDPYPGDVGSADLGCGIPQELVDVESWKTALSAMPGGLAKALNRALYAVQGTDRMERTLQMLHAGAGLAWSMRKIDGLPKFGGYDPIAPLQPSDAELVITRDDLAEAALRDEAQWTAIVELRDGGPYDFFEFAVDGMPGERGTNYEQIFESQDRAAPFREGRIPWPVIDEGLRDPTPWVGTAQAELIDWTGPARQRFAAGFGPYYAEQRRLYMTILNARFMTRIGVGTVVRVIDPNAESPDGTRGIDHMGRVLHPTVITRGDMRGAMRVVVELEARGVAETRIWAPSAIGGVGSWDQQTSTLTVRRNWTQAPGDHRDVDHFVQPAWDAGIHDPGLLDVVIYQSENGRDYPAQWEVRAQVSSVDRDADTMTLQNVVGPLYRDMVKFVVSAPLDEQTAPWAQALFVPITEADGTWGGGQPGRRIR